MADYTFSVSEYVLAINNGLLAGPLTTKEINVISNLLESDSRLWRYHDAQHTLYQGDEQIANDGATDGSLDLVSLPISPYLGNPRRRYSDPAIITPTSVNSTFRILTLTPVFGAPSAMTAIRYSFVTLNYIFTSNDWVPSILDAASLARVREICYGGDALPWAPTHNTYYPLTTAYEVAFSCPSSPTTHPGTLLANYVPYPPIVSGVTSPITAGPDNGRIRLLTSSIANIFYIWPSSTAGPKLLFLGPAGVPTIYRPWWGLPPSVDIWINSGNSPITVDLYLVQQLATLATLTGVEEIETKVFTVTPAAIVLGGLDFYVTSLTTASVGTLNARCIGFNYKLKIDIGGVITTITQNDFANAAGFWHRIPPADCGWSMIGAGPEDLPGPWIGLLMDIP